MHVCMYVCMYARMCVCVLENFEFDSVFLDEMHICKEMCVYVFICVCMHEPQTRCQVYVHANLLSDRVV
jgi:hypothetical protein